MAILSIIYHLAISFWAGGVAIFTFALSPMIFKKEQRDAAGRIVGYLFPPYFRWGLICGAVALVALVLRGGRETPWPATVLLLVMLAVTAFQALFIVPHAEDLKRQIPSFETTPVDHPLRRSFRKLHALSAICNLFVLLGGMVMIALYP